MEEKKSRSRSRAGVRSRLAGLRVSPELAQEPRVERSVAQDEPTI